MDVAVVSVLDAHCAQKGLSLKFEKLNATGENYKAGDHHSRSYLALRIVLQEELNVCQIRVL